MLLEFKNIIRPLIYVLTFVFVIGTQAQETNQFFEKANSFYNEGKYAEAIDNYLKVLENEEHSAELYFNLGNANYKLNNIAPSIYYYEKALQLNPNDEDIKNNLAYANNMTVDAIDGIPEIGLEKLLNNTARAMNFDSWAKLSVILVVFFVLLFLIYYFSFSAVRKRMTFVGSILALFFACIALAFTFHNYNLYNKDNPAIVFAEESQIRTEPNFRSEEAFKLHEGTKVQILDTVNNWKKIKLSDGKTGWVSSDEIKALKNN